MIRALLFGYGRMGRLVEAHAPAAGVEVVGVITREITPEQWDVWRETPLDVVIDFATGSALPQHAADLCAVARTLVIGSTGWADREDDVRATFAEHQVGAVVASNFSIGAHVLEAAARTTALLLRDAQAYEAFLHEAHHSAKRDAPSGTALSLLRAVRDAGYTQPVDVSSTRAGHIPGIHTFGIDGPDETLTLSHTVRDRSTFAQGALQAARWVQGRSGWFSMKDVLGIPYA
jgi:4-hydroxy-tetrahydrodipicolinate reductase